MSKIVIAELRRDLITKLGPAVSRVKEMRSVPEKNGVPIRILDEQTQADYEKKLDPSRAAGWLSPYLAKDNEWKNPESEICIARINGATATFNLDNPAEDIKLSILQASGVAIYPNQIEEFPSAKYLLRDANETTQPGSLHGIRYSAVIAAFEALHNNSLKTAFLAIAGVNEDIIPEEATKEQLLALLNGKLWSNLTINEGVLNEVYNFVRMKEAKFKATLYAKAGLMSDIIVDNGVRSKDRYELEAKKFKTLSALYDFIETGIETKGAVTENLLNAVNKLK